MADYQKMIDEVTEKHPETIGDLLKIVKEHVLLTEQQTSMLAYYLMDGRARLDNLERVITGIKEV